MPSRHVGETFGNFMGKHLAIFLTLSAHQNALFRKPPQPIEIPYNKRICRIPSANPFTFIRDPLGDMEQGWGHVMEWGVWIGRWGVGKHLAIEFCMIFGETL